MSRSDQNYGLNEAGNEFLAPYYARDEEKYPTLPCPHCGQYQIPEFPKSEEWATYRGMFGDEYPLDKITFSEGETFYEFLQAEPWSSGPCFLLALKDRDMVPIPETFWTEFEESPLLGEEASGE